MREVGGLVGWGGGGGGGICILVLLDYTAKLDIRA